MLLHYLLNFKVKSPFELFVFFLQANIFCWSETELSGLMQLHDRQCFFGFFMLLFEKCPFQPEVIAHQSCLS